MKPLYLILMTLCTNSLNAEPLTENNWQEQMAIGIGAGGAFSVSGLRLDIPLNEDMDMLFALGRGYSIGLQHKPLDVFPRFGFGAIYGSVAIAEDEWGVGEPCYGASFFAGIAPRHDRLSVSGGISYVLSTPKGLCADNAERIDGDPHWQASLGVHLPLRVRALRRLHN